MKVWCGAPSRLVASQLLAHKSEHRCSFHAREENRSHFGAQIGAASFRRAPVRYGDSRPEPPASDHKLYIVIKANLIADATWRYMINVMSECARERE
jgi:hypothetical protein